MANDSGALRLTTSLSLLMKARMLLVLANAEVEIDINCLGSSNWRLWAKWRLECIEAMCL